MSNAIHEKKCVSLQEKQTKMCLTPTVFLKKSIISVEASVHVHVSSYDKGQ